MPDSTPARRLARPKTLRSAVALALGTCALAFVLTTAARAEAKSNSEIAIILATSPRTIDKHMENIFVRLGVENRASLIITASERLR